MAADKHIINLSELPWDPINGPAGSRFGGERKRVGAKLGAKKLGYSFYKVAPGKTAFPYHTHSGNEEMIYIIGGTGILRLGDDEMDVSPGAVIACLPGTDYAHQLINTGAEDLNYLVVSTMDFPDISEYPDSKKIGAYAEAATVPGAFRALYARDQKLNYYDGEDGNTIERILRAKK